MDPTTVREKVEALINEVLQPLVQADGGNIELLRVEKNTVVLRLSGTCSGCPGKPYTTGGLIEPLLKKSLGESIEVRFQDT